mgnify:CR=1 FL=1
MDYDILYHKKEQLATVRSKIQQEALESFEKSFDVEYAHNSTAIEGNTMTLAQTKAILEGGKTLQEIVEIVAATEEARQDESPSVSSK